VSIIGSLCDALGTVDCSVMGSGVRGSSLSGRNLGPRGFIMESVVFGQGWLVQ
jgi:hypothetical protein